MENLKKAQLMNKAQYCTNCNKKLNTIMPIDNNKLSKYQNVAVVKITRQESLVNSEKDLHNPNNYDRYIIPIQLVYRKDEKNSQKRLWITTDSQRTNLDIWTSIYNDETVYLKISSEPTPYKRTDGTTGTYDKLDLIPKI